MPDVAFILLLAFISRLPNKHVNAPNDIMSYKGEMTNAISSCITGKNIKADSDTPLDYR